MVKATSFQMQEGGKEHEKDSEFPESPAVHYQRYQPAAGTDGGRDSRCGIHAVAHLHLHWRGHLPHGGHCECDDAAALHGQRNGFAGLEARGGQAGGGD